MEKNSEKKSAIFVPPKFLTFFVFRKLFYFLFSESMYWTTYSCEEQLFVKVISPIVGWLKSLCTMMSLYFYVLSFISQQTQSIEFYVRAVHVYSTAQRYVCQRQSGDVLQRSGQQVLSVALSIHSGRLCEATTLTSIIDKLLNVRRMFDTLRQ